MSLLPGQDSMADDELVDDTTHSITRFTDGEGRHELVMRTRTRKTLRCRVRVVAGVQSFSIAGILNMDLNRGKECSALILQ